MNEKIFLNNHNISIDRNDMLKILGIDENDIVFLAGSLIEGNINKMSKGMGNSYSDIDVFILTDNINSKTDVDYDKDKLKYKFTEYCGIGVDIEIYEKSLIQNILSQLNKLDINENVRIYNYLNIPGKIQYNEIISFFHRLINSIPLQNENLYFEFKNMINKNYYRIVIRENINKIDNQYDDILGNIESNQLEVSIVLAREILLEIIKSYIFYREYSVDRNKWIPLIIKNLSTLDNEANTIYTKFKQLYFENSLNNEENILNYIKEVLEFNNYITSLIEKKDGI